MFGRKPQPKAAAADDDENPWVVQVLTRDYLVEGFTDGEDDDGDSSTFLEVNVGEDMNGALLTLSQPNLQPAGAITVTAPPNCNWVLPANTEFVAVIPGNDSALAYAVKQTGGPNKAIGAVVMAAHYMIQGVILCPGTGLEMLSDYVQFAMQDATVDYVGPGARLTKLEVPLIFVRTSQVQGIFVNA